MEENQEMKEVKEENHEMKTELKQEVNEEVKVEEHQDPEPDLHPLNTTNRTDPAASSGPSDLQVKKMTQKRKAPALRNEDTDEVVKKRLTYDPSGPWPSTSSSSLEAESTDLQISETATMMGAAPALLGFSSVSVAPATGRPRHSLRPKKKKIPSLVELRTKLRTYQQIISKIISKVETVWHVITVTESFIERIPISGRRATYYSWKSAELLKTCKFLLDEIAKLAKSAN